MFDLFGTLVHELPRKEFWASVDAIADSVGAERSAFRDGWNVTSVGRQTGLSFERQTRDLGLGDLPYPPDYPKMPGEPMRVQPSRARRPTSEDG